MSAGDYWDSTCQEERRRVLLLEGVPSDALDGGWTVRGIMKSARDAEAQLAAARELLTEIRDGEVNVVDECDKFLRSHERSSLSKVTTKLKVAQAAMIDARAALFKFASEDASYILDLQKLDAAIAASQRAL